MDTWYGFPHPLQNVCVSLSMLTYLDFSTIKKNKEKKKDKLLPDCKQNSFCLLLLKEEKSRRVRETSSVLSLTISPVRAL